MLYFIVRILVNAIALGITVALLPGVTLTPLDPSPGAVLLSYLLIGVLFGALNALVRPIVLFITGNLLISQMALVVLLTNTVLMAILDFLVPQVFEVDDLFSLITAGVVMALTVFLLEAIFGLDSPTLEDAHAPMPFYWRWLSQLPTGRRNRIIENMRLHRVYDTIWRYGMDIVLDQSPFAGFRQFMQRLIFRRKHAIIDQSAPETVRLMLQELGPTYVKIGQMVSSRSEALPLEWQQELEHLQSDVPPFSYELAHETIVKELGASPEEIYASFEREPFAAASTAQVHKATLADGRVVAVKVQRPSIEILVRTDLNVMHDIVQVLEKRIAWARANDLSGMLDEFAKNVMEELDYENEAYNGTRLAYAMRSFNFIHVPEIIPALSAKRVLTMEFVQGVKITSTAEMDARGLDRELLAREFTEAILKQVLFDGFFHGDPHPGNLMVDLETGKIIFLDLGMIGTLTSEQRLDLGELILALHQKDAYSLAQVALRLSDRLHPVDEKAFARGMDRLVSRYMIFATEGTSLSRMMTEFLSILYQYGLRMKAELTLAVKAIIQSEEVVRTLAPHLSMIEVAFEVGRKLIFQQMTPENIGEVVEQQVNRVAHDVVRQLPELSQATLSWITQYKKGRFVVDLDVNTDNVAHQVDRIRISIEQLTVGLIVVGLLIGSAIVTNIPVANGFLGLTYLAFLIFVSAAMFGFYYLWRILRDVGRNKD